MFEPVWYVPVTLTPWLGASVPLAEHATAVVDDVAVVVAVSCDTSPGHELTHIRPNIECKQYLTIEFPGYFSSYSKHFGR